MNRGPMRSNRTPNDDTRLAMRYNGRMYQFSIRSLLIATAAVAVLVWVLFAPPHGAGALVMLLVSLALPAATVAGIVYGRGYWRSFLIGASPVVVAMTAGISLASIDILEDRDWPELFMLSSRDAVECKMMLGPPLAIVVISGLIGMGIRRLLVAPLRSHAPSARLDDAGREERQPASTTERH